MDNLVKEILRGLLKIARIHMFLLQNYSQISSVSLVLVKMQVFPFFYNIYHIFSYNICEFQIIKAKQLDIIR